MSTNEKNNNVKYDTENFKVRVFAIVPPDYALVTTNIFTGKSTTLSAGAHVIAPWNRSIYVSITTESIDYTKREFEVKDQFNVIVDYAIEVRVSDPAKYVFATRDNNAKVMLEKRLDKIMYRLSRTSYYNELATIKLNINDIKDPMMNEIKKELDEFSNLYGLEVVALNIKSVDQTKEMSEKFQETQKRKIDNQNKIEAAQAEFEAEKKKVEAIAYKMKILKEQGLSKEEILKIVQTQIMIESGNAQFMNFSGDNTNAASFGAQFQAGVNMINDNKQTQKKR